MNLFGTLSKQRNHCVTIGYFDGAGKEKITVFELGDDIVLSALHIAESRSGKRILMQDEARKSGQ